MEFLAKVASPADLRALSRSELDDYCGEVRQFIVEAVSRTGGHLGSNLGVVELTVALHRVFESPRDALVFDTGHQVYVHKIITGRADGFTTLRQFGGLSGYPSRAESDHDWVENSHASTALSWASGLAAGFKLSGLDHRRVVAVVGDGSLTGGMAFEALNNMGHYGQRTVIVLNDNGRSYAPTVSLISSVMSRLRQSPHYVQSRQAVTRLLGRVPMGQEVRRGLDSAAAALREIWEPPAFFETLGVRYIGPVDGHDVGALEQALRDAAAYEQGPIVVHATTQKGRGYEPAELDDEKHLHDTGTFNPAVGPLNAATDALPATYTEAFTAALVDIADTDSRVVAITAAMGGSTGLLPFERRWPDRFFDVGIAEQHALTAAAGMARTGLRPVVAIYSTFVARAFDQLMYDVGLHGAPVVLCIDRAGITGPDGASHHGLFDIAMATAVPGVTVLAPSSAQELDVMLRWAVEQTAGPVAIRWPRGKAQHSAEVGEGLAARLVVSDEAAAEAAGSVNGGVASRVCLLAAGAMLQSATQAAQLLADDGVAAAVWDARCLKPLCPEMLAQAVGYPLVVTLEDGVARGGFGSAVNEAIQRGPQAVVPRVLQLGVPDEYVTHGSASELHAELGLDALGIKTSVSKMLTRLG